jgi:hypothetical protein
MENSSNLGEQFTRQALMKIINQRKYMYKVGEILVIIAFLLIVISRFYYPLDQDLSMKLVSEIWYGDEGWNSGNAISKYLTNHWLCDGFNQVILMPAMSLIQYSWFKAVGLSWYKVRLLYVLFSFVLIILGYLLIRNRMKKEKEAIKYVSILSFLFLIGTNLYFYGHSRLALYDIPMATFGMASLILLIRMLDSITFKRKAMWAFCSWTLLTTAILTKTAAVQYVVAILIFAAMHFVLNKRRITANFVLMLLTAVLAATISSGVLAILRTLYVVPDSDALYHLISDKMPTTIEQMFVSYKHLFSHDFIKNNYLLFYGSLLSMVMVFIVPFIKKERPHKIDLLLSASYISSLLFLGSIYYPYQSIRYFMVLPLPMIYFVSLLPSVIGSLHPTASKAFSSVGVGIIILFLLFANKWNSMELARYFTAPKTTMITSIARGIEKDIANDAASNNYSLTPLLINSLFGSTFAADNHMPFRYFIPAKRNKYEYIFSHYKFGPTTNRDPYGKDRDWPYDGKYLDFTKLHIIKIYKVPLNDTEVGYLFRQDL